MKLVRASIVLVLSAVYFSYVFQFSHKEFLTSGLGDWIDPYFINFLLEHWHHSLWSFTDPSSPAMYFPARGTLGYSHGLILYAPFYVAVRPFLEPFQAYTLTLFLVLLTGSSCLYLVLRKFLRLEFIESLLLSAFFVSSQNVINGRTGIWSQRASVFLVPPILLLALVSARMPMGRPRLMLAWLSGLLTLLLFTQDFYTAQLGLLVAIFLLAGVLLLTTAPLRQAAIEVRHTAASAMRDHHEAPWTRCSSWWWLVVACAGLASAVAIWIHPIPRTLIGSWRFTANDPTRPLVIACLTGGWFIWRGINWEMAAAVIASVLFRSPVSVRIATSWKRRGPYILAFTSGALVGGLVFVWIYAGAYREHHVFPEDQLMNALTALNRGHVGVMEALRAYSSPRSFELVFVVGILAWVPWFQVGRNDRLYGLWFLLLSGIVLVVALRFNDFSLWKTVFAPIPGLSVIRDPKRIIEPYELAVVLLTGLFMTRLPRTSAFRMSIAVFVLLLLVTERNREVFDFGRPTSVYDRWVTAPIDIDASCQSFFIKGASTSYMSRSGHMWSLYAIDAMFISLNHHIPTLNGYSAWYPEVWSLTNPQEDDYLKHVGEWIGRNHLNGVCAFDIEARTMTPYRPASASE